MGNQANLYLVKIWYIKLNVSMRRRGLDCLLDQINHLGKYLGKCTLSGPVDAKSSFPRLYSTRDHHKEEAICPTELHIAFSDHPHLYMITYSLLENHAPFSKGLSSTAWVHGWKNKLPLRPTLLIDHKISPSSTTDIIPFGLLASPKKEKLIVSVGNCCTPGMEVFACDCFCPCCSWLPAAGSLRTAAFSSSS